MATEERGFKEVDAAAHGTDERRKAEVVALAFPNDRFPTTEELTESIQPTSAGKEVNFFRDKGPLFTACWWLNHFAAAVGGDARKVPQQDLQDRLTIFRESDVAGAIRKARAWYSESAK